MNKAEDNDWFKIEPNKEGTKWTGKCWIIYELVKYEFQLEFEIPMGYPLTPIEMVLPELDGKTEKMYRGGKICIDIHFAPQWQKNAPKWGIVHGLALAVDLFDSSSGLGSTLKSLIWLTRAESRKLSNWLKVDN